MGKRTLGVETSQFVEFFKRRDGQLRSFTVTNGLPDDARVVEERCIRDRLIGIVLESAEWAGVDDSYGALETPRVTLHWVATLPEPTSMHGSVR